MTRINVIDPYLITDQHLLAEYRELPRVFGLVRDSYSQYRCIHLDQVPEAYVLGTGHVRFFYNKLAYVNARHAHIRSELIRRGYTLQTYPAYKRTLFPLDTWNNWKVTEEAVLLNLKRLVERMEENLGVYTHKKSKEEAKELYDMYKKSLRLAEPMGLLNFQVKGVSYVNSQ